MDIDFEEKIIHNPLIGAVTLWHFVKRYQISGQEKIYPSILKIVLVIPLLSSQDVVAKLRYMHFASGLNKVLLDEPTFVVGLQERLVGYAELSLQSLNIACASGLLRAIKGRSGDLRFATDASLIPKSAMPSRNHVAIAAAAERLGAYFRMETERQIELKLRIRL